MRLQAQVKIHELKGPRLPWRPQEAEVRENEYKYLDADGILVPDGVGILYWVDAIITTDAGSVIVYDNNAASGKILAGIYKAKAPDGKLKNYDPPKLFEHGLYVDVDKAVVEVCYRPIARNLRCLVTVEYAPGEKNLVARVTVVYISGTRALVCRLTVTEPTPATTDLVSRLTVRQNAEKDLIAQATVRQNSSANLVSQLTVTSTKVTEDLVCKVTVRQNATSALVCHLYADRTE